VRSIGRWWARLATLVVLVAVALSLGAGSASAHAQLEHTSPASGAVWRVSPTLVTLTFGETVGVASDDVQVYDDALHRVDQRDAAHVDGRGDTVGVRLRPHLHDGTYSVTWRVISADSHPVSGGFTFSVGHPTRVVGKVGTLGGGSRLVGVLLGAMRFLGYLGLVGGIGVLAFAGVWPALRRDRGSRRLVAAGVVAGAVSAVGIFLLQAPYGQGEGISRAVDGGLLSGVAHSHFGKVVLARLALWLALGAAAAVALRGRRAGWLALPLAAGLIVTWPLAGHGDTGGQVPLSIVSESVHVAAVSVWMGGLLALVLRLLPGADPIAFDVLPRFSRIALWCVGLLLVTGLYQAWREIGLSWTALVTTTYGRLVAAKILGVVALIGLGAFARWSLGWVRRGEASDDELQARRRVVRWHLRNSLLFELEIGVAVLVFTSILVNSIPATEAADYSLHRTLRADGIQVQVVVDQARVGTDDVTLTVLTPSGDAQRISQATGSLSLPARGIAQLPVSFDVKGQTNVAAATVTIPVSGQWRLAFDVQTSPIAATAFAADFTVHSAS
jgi:copper transport protein